MTGVPIASLADVWCALRDPVPVELRRRLAAAAAGVLVVGGSVPPGASGDASATPLPADDRTTSGRALAVAIRALPAAAGALAWLDDAAPTPAQLAALVSHLAGHDGVLVATPVSDAVKRVSDGRVVGGVSRDGLCRPGPPLVVRAGPARERLLPALDDGHDPVAALSVAGCVVDVVTPARLGQTRESSTVRAV